MNDYGLRAYRKAGKDDEERPESISRQIRRNAEPGHEPLVHKAVFEKINTKIDELSKQKDAEAEKQAELASRTGTWFEKKTSTTSEDVKRAAANLTSGGMIKVPQQEVKPGEKESIYRRVAKFLVIIGVDEAAKILPHLTEEQTEKIIPEIATIKSISPEEAEAVLEEFDSLVVKAREEGGLDTARTILTKAYGSEKAEELISKSVKFPGGRPFEYLADADPERIRILIDGESVAVQALVLSQLEPKKSAQVINAMEPEKKSAIVLRLAKMQKVAPEVIANIDKSLHEKMLTQNTENSQNLDGRGVLAQILKRMDPSAEGNIINALSEQDPDLGADLRKRLFTEEDVVSCEDRFLQEQLRQMSDTDVMLLIRGKSEDFRSKIFHNISKGRGDTVLEEESLHVKVLKSDCERITSQFFSILRRAWERGDLRIEGRDDGEVYV